jgi:hypothetical protein
MGSHIIPVLYKSVKVFKEPPKSRTHWKKYHVENGAIKKDALPSSMVSEGVNGDNITDPEGRESVCLKLSQPRETIPGQYPCNNTKDDAEPAPPGEWKRAGWAMMLSPFSPLYPLDEERSNNNQDKYTEKQESGPGKVGMLNINCSRRKLQIE